MSFAFLARFGRAVYVTITRAQFLIYLCQYLCSDPDGPLWEWCLQVGHDCAPCVLIIIEGR